MISGHHIAKFDQLIIVFFFFTFADEQVLKINIKNHRTRWIDPLLVSLLLTINKYFPKGK